MALAFRNADVAAIATDRMARAILDPSDAAALMDLSLIAECQGRRAEGLRHQARALEVSPLYSYPAAAPGGLRLLMFAAPGDLRTNTPIELILRGRDVSLITLYLRAGRPLPDRVPDHDLALVGVSQFDATRDTLTRLAAIAAAWPRPVLNAPHRILDLARDRLPHVLTEAPGLVCPATARVSRRDLDAIAAGAAAVADFLPRHAFPIIARPVDAHGGEALARCADADGLAAYLAGASAPEFHIAPFVDTAVDGKFRKYRIALIDRRPFLCHLAISSHWSVNYQNAGMDRDAAKREEEHRAFRDFDAFGRRHAQALRTLAERIDLDYVVLDCAEMHDGRLLLFEADNAAVIHDLDPPELFPYKRDPMRKAFDAFGAMLGAAAVRNPGRERTSRDGA